MTLFSEPTADESVQPAHWVEDTGRLSDKDNMDNHKESLKELGKDGAFFRNNYAALLAQYPNQWIAVKWQRVVAAAANYFDAEAQLKKQGIAHNEALWEFMAEDRTFLVGSNWDLDDD